jgi:hypothetical protein
VKQINFLPESCRQKQRQRQRVAVHAGIVAALVLAEAGAALGGWRYLDTLHARQLALQARLPHGQIVKQLRRDRQQLALLDRLQQASKAVGRPLPAAGLLTQIFQALPPHTAIRSLRVETLRQAVNTRRHPKGAIPKFHFALHVQLTGVAKGKGQIALFIHHLHENPLFGGVQLGSQPAIIRHRIVHQFTLHFRAHVNRMYNGAGATGRLAMAAQ